MSPPLRRYTVDELASLPEDGSRYELLDGVLMVTPPATLPHNYVGTQLAAELITLLAPWPNLLVTAPGAVLFRPHTLLIPDVLVFREPPGGLSAEWDDVRDYLLAIEVWSPSTGVRDRKIKRPAYFRLGVKEVWRVRSEERRFSISTRDALHEVSHHGDFAWTPAGLDTSLTVPVDRIFQRLSR